MQTEREKTKKESEEIFNEVKYEELACSILDGVEFKDGEAIAKAVYQLGKYLQDSDQPSIRERILCAAIWFDDGNKYPHQPTNIETGLVFCGWRHGCIFSQIGGTVAERKQLGIHEKQQGFLTSQNRFINRTEAWHLAKTTNQLLPEARKQTDRQLFSEELILKQNENKKTLLIHHDFPD